MRQFEDMTDAEQAEFVIDSVAIIINKTYVDKLITLANELRKRGWYVKEKVIIDLITFVSKSCAFDFEKSDNDCPIMASYLMSKMAGDICQSQIDKGESIDPMFKDESEMSKFIKLFSKEKQTFEDIISQCNFSEEGE